MFSWDWILFSSYIPLCVLKMTNYVKNMKLLEICNLYLSHQGGNLSDALVDLTSGVSAHLDLTIGGYVDDFEKRKQLFKMMSKEMAEHSLMCCAITVSITLI